MSTDAIALLRPRDFHALEPFLDLDEDSEESDGLYADVLADGAVLVHTFQPFEAFAADPGEGRAWLAQFGEQLGLVHDDPRGVLFFPDELEPDAASYAAVVEAVEAGGVWIPTHPTAPSEAAPSPDAEGQGLLQKLAASLQFGASPHDLATAVTALQKNVFDALGLGGLAAGDGAEGLEGDDEEGLVVLLRGGAPLAAALDLDGFALGDVAALDDGTAVVPTVYTPLARELVALRLAEDLAGLVGAAGERVDPRGVPACTTSDLDRLADAHSYDDALAALGDRAVFLDLRAARALPDAEKARLRSLGEE